MTDKPSFVKPQAADDQTLAAVQKKVAEARDLEMEIKNLEERLKERKADYNRMLQETLPTTFNEARLKQVTIEASGNQPAVSVEVKPYYQAHVPVSWPEEQRQEAFQYLESQKAGALIKTQLIISFDRMDHAKAKKLEKEFTNKNFLKWIGIEALDYERKDTVNHQNLAAWVRERHEAKKATDLDKIGGYIGQKAIIKAVKEKTK